MLDMSFIISSGRDDGPPYEVKEKPEWWDEGDWFKEYQKLIHQTPPSMPYAKDFELFLPKGASTPYRDLHEHRDNMIKSIQNQICTRCFIDFGLYPRTEMSRSVFGDIDYQLYVYLYRIRFLPNERGAYVLQVDDRNLEYVYGVWEKFNSRIIKRIPSIDMLYSSYYGKIKEGIS